MDARLTDLEVRYTYLEHTVGDLNQIILELRAEIEKLRRDVAAVRDLVMMGPGADPPNEKPPHF